MLRSHLSAALPRYVTAVVAVAAALVSTVFLRSWTDPHTTPLFLAAVMISAWLGGVGPSLLATLLSAVAIDYFFVSQLYGLEWSIDNFTRTSVFVLVALFISWIDHARKRAIKERDRLLVSERAARVEAETANRAKDTFLAMVTHELRTPLTAILGWTRILRAEKPPDDATAARALKAIERNAQLQTQLVEDLLDISRFVAGTLRVEASRIRLVPVIESAVEVVRLAANQKGVRLHTEFDHDVGPAMGDADRLRQVLLNLLSNAIKFTPHGGRIEVRLDRIDSEARIAVSDTGHGIAPDFLPYVFDRFRQADETASRAPGGGLGLGLAIARHLTEAHGGSIRAESQGQDRGTTFTVCLPLIPGTIREDSLSDSDNVLIASGARNSDEG